MLEDSAILNKLFTFQNINNFINNILFYFIIRLKNIKFKISRVRI